MERNWRARRITVEMDTALRRSAWRSKSRYEGFDEFYRDNWDAIYRTITLTIRDADLAKEAVDEAMVRALSDWHQIRSGPNPSGWVYRTAFNWSVDQIRKRKRAIRFRTAGETAHWDPDTSDPDLTEMINSLTMDQRAVLVLRVVQDLSQEEVAEVLGVPVGTVKSRLARALAALRLEVEEK